MNYLMVMFELSMVEIIELLCEVKVIKEGIECFDFLGKFVVNLFFELSMRMWFSFEVVEKKFGMNVFNLDGMSISV